MSVHPIFQSILDDFAKAGHIPKPAKDVCPHGMTKPWSAYWGPCRFCEPENVPTDPTPGTQS